MLDFVGRVEELCVDLHCGMGSDGLGWAAHIQLDAWTRLERCAMQYNLAARHKWFDATTSSRNPTVAAANAVLRERMGVASGRARSS